MAPAKRGSLHHFEPSLFALRSLTTEEPTPTPLDFAIAAALDKKARDVVVLDLAEVCSFSDHFLICTGSTIRQTQSVADHVAEKLRDAGLRPSHIEGYTEGEWILMDYLDFVVHVFTARAREFYNLERLWRTGRRRDIPETIGQQA